MDLRQKFIGFAAKLCNLLLSDFFTLVTEGIVWRTATNIMRVCTQK